MKTIKEIILKATEFLEQKGIENPRRQAEEVIGDAIDLKRLQLYMEFDRPLTEEELNKCRSCLSRRAKGEPPQYIRGFVDFMGCTLKVTSNVLIPRQETEILVDLIIHALEKEPLEGKTLWDLCCGSGCIGIALKKRFPELKVVLSDVSGAALNIASENAKTNGVEVSLLQGNFLEPFHGMITDYFVCNPPYVSEEEYANLDKEVKEYEPRLALLAKEDGLEFYRRLANDLPVHLNPSGKTWLEIGYRQGEAVNSLFSCPPWIKSEWKKDWAGKDRFFFLEIE
ncbi:MAG: Release factor glutamine methyltransferase [Chlamydiae bacterium]|nr:Release factor glutamine methyltransferase [Chlamydiota bacterium]